MNTPNPSMLANLKRAPQVAAVVQVEAAAKTVVNPAGICKAKHLKDGQSVRAFLHGEPRGGLHTVASVTRIDDGALVIVTFTSGQATTRKASYRYYDEALAAVVEPTVAPSSIGALISADLRTKLDAVV